MQKWVPFPLQSLMYSQASSTGNQSYISPSPVKNGSIEDEMAITTKVVLTATQLKKAQMVVGK